MHARVTTRQSSRPGTSALGKSLAAESTARRNRRGRLREYRVRPDCALTVRGMSRQKTVMTRGRNIDLSEQQGSGGFAERNETDVVVLKSEAKQSSRFLRTFCY